MVWGASVKEQIGGTTRRPRYKFDTSGWCAHHPTQGPMLFDNIPSKQSIDLVGSKMMPVYAISETSSYFGKECVGCTEAWRANETHKSGADNAFKLWNEVWGFIEKSDASAIEKLKTEPKNLTRLNSNLKLNTHTPRATQPVILALAGAHEGGDNWLNDCCAGHQGNFVDVYHVSSPEYQIYIEFEEHGLKVNATLIHNGQPNAAVNSVFGIPTYGFNQQSSHVPYGASITPNVTASQGFCIDQVEMQKWVEKSAGKTNLNGGKKKIIYLGIY